MLEFNKGIGSHCLSDLHHDHVAGPLNSFLHSQKTITISVMAPDRPSTNFQTSFTVIGLCSCDLAAFHACRYRKGLGYRSRLIGAADTVVLPESIQMLVQHFLIIQYIHILFCQVLSCFISLLIK